MLPSTKKGWRTIAVYGAPTSLSIGVQLWWRGIRVTSNASGILPFSSRGVRTRSSMNLKNMARHLLLGRDERDARSARNQSVDPPGLSILDQYVRRAPDPQNAIDIFQGEWSSRLPEPFSDVRAGQIA